MIEQREDAFPPALGSRSEPAEVANALEAFGQDVLEEAAQELSSLKAQGAPALIVGVFILKDYATVVRVENAL